MANTPIDHIKLVARWLHNRGFGSHKPEDLRRDTGLTKAQAAAAVKHIRKRFNKDPSFGLEIIQHGDYYEDGLIEFNRR